MRRIVTYVIRGTSDPRVAREIALHLYNAGAAPKGEPRPKPDERKTR
jgi:hypothetical protein